jgi:hypothetical protein
MMPGTPKERKEGDSTLFEVTRDQESIRYSVGFLDLLVAPENDRQLQNEVYEGFRRGAEAGKVRLKSYRSIDLNGFPGREMNFSLPNNLVARWRVYLVNKRAYFVSVTTTPDNLQRGLSKSVTVFFNSFQVSARAIPPTPIPRLTPVPTPSSSPTPAPIPNPLPAPMPGPLPIPTPTPTPSPLPTPNPLPTSKP